MMLKNGKIYIIGVIILALLFAGAAIGSVIRGSSAATKSVYNRIEEVKHIRHLELVTYYFESIVDVSHEEKTDKVYLLMIIPARVSCYIDLDRMSYTLNDTLVHIYLPDPELEAPVLDLDSARIFNMNQRYVTASKKSYETVVRNVQSSMIRAKQDVLYRATSNGIKDDARRLGEIYFRSLFSGMGYEVEFSMTESTPEI